MEPLKVVGIIVSSLTLTFATLRSSLSQNGRGEFSPILGEMSEGQRGVGGRDTKRKFSTFLECSRKKKDYDAFAS